MTSTSSQGSVWFLVDTMDDLDAIRGLGLDAVLVGYADALIPSDSAVLLAPSERLFAAAKIAEQLVGEFATVGVAEIPHGHNTVAEAVQRGTSREDFLDAAEQGATARGSGDGDAKTRPAYRPFPLDAVPEPLATFIQAGAAAIGCEPSFIALPLLSAVGAAIGNARRLRLKNGWSVPPIIWTMIVGESGTHKSPAFALALRAIREAQARAFADHANAVEAWSLEHAQWEKAHTAWKRDADAGEPPPEPVRPSPRRHVVSDTTTEALAPILLDNPRGVLLARDELSGWVNSFDRYAKAGRGGADVAHWLSMHDGGPITVDRKTGSQTIHVPLASICVAGGIQPRVLARAMGAEHHENGMLARLLFAMPPRRPRRWTEADIDPAISAAVAEVIGRLLDLAPETDPEGNDRPVLVSLTPAARRAWVAFYDAHAQEQARMVGDLAAAWSKLEGYAARFALIVHLVRVVAGDRLLADPNSLDESSIGAGVTLARWFGEEARRVYAVLTETDDDAEARRLAEWITTKHGGTATARDLTHGLRRFREDPDGAADALDDLETRGLGRWEHVQNRRGGPTVSRFVLGVPGVTVTTTPAGDPVAGGFGDGDSRGDDRAEGAA